VSLSLPRLHNQASSFLFLDRHSNQGGEIRIPESMDFESEPADNK